MGSGPVIPDVLDAILSRPDDLVDRATLRSILTRRPLDQRFELEDVEPTYLRAKHGTSATLGLLLHWRSGGEACVTRASLYLASSERVREAAAKALTLRTVAPEAGPTVAHVPEPPALFLAFPNDRWLRGLSAAADPRRLKNRLHAAAGPFSHAGLRVRRRGTRVWPVRWKPGRRAVLCARLALRDEPSGSDREATVYVRVYPHGDMSAPLARWRAAERLPVRSPRVMAVDEARGFFVVKEFAGAPELLGETPHTALEPLVGVLSAMYGADPGPDWGPVRRDRDDLHAAHVALDDLRLWYPDIAEAAREVCSRLTAAARRLRVAPARALHGDLTADQVLFARDDVSILDWDEASIGDPHADLASLAADLEMRHRGKAMAESLLPGAREALGSAWDEERWRWQTALAFSRRCLSALQTARADWREPARRAVAEALQWCPPAPVWPVPRSVRSGARATPAAVAPGDVDEFLTALGDRERRGRLPGVDAGMVLAAVWPDGDGAQARLENPECPGQPAVWLRMRDRLEVWTFPSDPALPSLASLASRSDVRVAGHRLARRATLAECRVPRSYLHLRPPAQAPEIFGRVQAVHEELTRRRIGVPPLAYAAEPGGWRSRAVPGRPLDPAATDEATWTRFGDMLARVHAVRPPEQLPHAGEGAAFLAARRQIALVMGTRTSFATWIGRALEAWWSPGAERNGRPPALVHGDLHPAQMISGAGEAIIDWDQAHAGDPEEDLGNLAAHLWWARADSQQLWRAFVRGYADAGGTVDAHRFATHARLSLLRVLAVHSWRDADRGRCLDLERWEDWPQECARW